MKQTLRAIVEGLVVGVIIIAIAGFCGNKEKTYRMDTVSLTCSYEASEDAYLVEAVDADDNVWGFYSDVIITPNTELTLIMDNQMTVDNKDDEVLDFFFK